MLIISPYAKPLQNGKQNPKNYPYWKELIELIGDKDQLVQVGVAGEEQLVEDFRPNLSIKELKVLLYESWNWIGVDSFFQHLAWDSQKPGIVLWSVSDPLIFGHPENENLLKDRSYLAKNQFLWWDFTEYNKEAFVSPEVVLEYLYKSSR